MVSIITLDAGQSDSRQETVQPVNTKQINTLDYYAVFVKCIHIT